MMMPLKDHAGLETLMNLMLIRFGVIAAVVVAVVIALFATALWLRRRGSLGQATRHAGPLARKAAAYRMRSKRGRYDLVSTGLTMLATALERNTDDLDEVGAGAHNDGTRDDRAPHERRGDDASDRPRNGGAE